MIHEFTRQARLIVAYQRDTVFPGDILCRYDDEFVPCNSRTECDLVDPAPRNLAANRGPKQHIGQNHIVDVHRSAGYLIASLLAGNGIADDAFAVHPVLFTLISSL